MYYLLSQLTHFSISLRNGFISTPTFCISQQRFRLSSHFVVSLSAKVSIQLPLISLRKGFISTPTFCISLQRFRLSTRFVVSLSEKVSFQLPLCSTVSLSVIISSLHPLFCISLRNGSYQLPLFSISLRKGFPASNPFFSHLTRRKKRQSRPQ